ncbi:MAG: hypothetical protein QM770_03965 [Tepidisphaeraceae bacterium]
MVGGLERERGLVVHVRLDAEQCEQHEVLHDVVHLPVGIEAFGR